MKTANQYFSAKQTAKKERNRRKKPFTENIFHSCDKMTRII